MTIKEYGSVGLWGGGVKSAVTLLMITPPNSVVCVRLGVSVEPQIR